MLPHYLYNSVAEFFVNFILIQQTVRGLVWQYFYHGSINYSVHWRQLASRYVVRRLFVRM